MCVRAYGRVARAKVVAAFFVCSVDKLVASSE